MKSYVGYHPVLRAVLPKAPHLILSTIRLYYLVSSSPRLIRAVLPKAPHLILSTICLYYLASSSPRLIELMQLIIIIFAVFHHNSTEVVAIIDSEYYVSKGSVPVSV